MISDKVLNRIFQLFMITTYGLGYYYNNLFRIGEIFPSDPFIMLFLLAFFIKVLTTSDGRIKESVIIIYFIAIFMLLMGLVASAAFGNILRDFKIFLYFFIPYLYLKHIKSNYSLQKSNIILFGLLIITSLALNWINFLNKGSVNLDDYGIIQRTFGIGLSFNSAILLSAFVAVYKNEFIKRFGTIIYYALQIVCILSVIVSFTRTMWIMYLLVHGLRIIFINASIRNIKLESIKSFPILVFLAVSLGFISNYLDESGNLYYKAIMNRAESIDIFNPDHTDTLSYRIEDVSSAFYKFNSPRIIFGYGFGDTRAAYGYNAMLRSEEFNTENSFFYYIWKYGVIVAFYLFIKVLRKMYILFKGTTKAEKMMSIFLSVYMLVGSMSGNLNNTYSIVIIAFYIGINLELVFLSDRKKLSNKNQVIIKERQEWLVGLK